MENVLSVDTFIIFIFGFNIYKYESPASGGKILRIPGFTGASKFQRGKRNLLEKLSFLGQFMVCMQFKNMVEKVKLGRF